MAALDKYINKGNPTWRKHYLGWEANNLSIKKLMLIIRRLLDVITMKIWNHFLLGGINEKKNLISCKIELDQL